MKIYTKTGDKGQTSLVSGTRISKADIRLEAYGTLDELNSILGMAVVHLHKDDYDIAQTIQNKQNHLFTLGSHLACDKEDVKAKLPTTDPEWIKSMEEEIDLWQKNLPELKNFILPGGCAEAATLHLARTVARRAERLIVQLSEHIETDSFYLEYLNRLSDWLFVLARKCNNLNNHEDILWTGQ